MLALVWSVELLLMKFPIAAVTQVPPVVIPPIITEFCKTWPPVQVVVAPEVPLTLKPVLLRTVPVATTVPLVVVLPLGATLNLLLLLSWRSNRLPVPLALVLLTVSMAAVAWLEVSVRRPKVGVAAVSMFWIVLTTPLATEKLVLLNWAIPLALVEALSIVIVVPTPDALESVNAPTSPLTLSTA